MDNTRPTLRVCSLHGGLGLHRRCTRAQRSHQMALIERFFGRLKTVCAILSGKWTFSRAELPAVFAECVCVTHYHVSINPLTQDDDGIEQAVYDNAFMDLEEAAEGRREADRSRKISQEIDLPFHESVYD
ncbi:hypothetical protein BLNAU_19615 [Blattamonas nauphoetae]|uniref:DDE Tnp4 domain-containing protein n=1 Tax=Blattamonas nauphoetae TaxID=2049346 RepID=A0ABQ9X0Z2_9EUKA|nr:hypothetical protein BLNAU_19615 [Blattamonas nauphoetae]